MANSRLQRDSHAALSVTNFNDGYHIVWKSSYKGKDSLHDSNGYRFGYVTNPNGSFKAPTDREAFWRCTGNHRLPQGNLKRCWVQKQLLTIVKNTLLIFFMKMVVRELDGIISTVPGRQHMNESHLPVRRKSEKCQKCFDILK